MIIVTMMMMMIMIMVTMIMTIMAMIMAMIMIMVMIRRTLIMFALCHSVHPAGLDWVCFYSSRQNPVVK